MTGKVIGSERSCSNKKLSGIRLNLTHPVAFDVLERHQRDGRERADLFLARSRRRRTVDLRHAQRPAGADDFADRLEPRALAGLRKLILYSAVNSHCSASINVLAAQAPAASAMVPRSPP